MKTKQKTDLKKIIKLLFAAAVILLLLSPLVRAIAAPMEINVYESRPANQLPALTAKGFADMSCQDAAEDALSDQLPMSPYFKKAYNALKFGYQELVSMPLIRGSENKYFDISGVGLINGMLAYHPETLEAGKAKHTPVLAAYNRVIETNPETDFYLLYVESDHDINFETGEKPGFSDYILSYIDLPEERKACLELNDFPTFRRRFYATDHHWQWLGAYDGYLEILRLLGCEEDALRPAEEVSFPRPWRGSKSNFLGYDGMTEIFTAYRFDYPPMKVTIEGREAEDYGMQNWYFENPDSVITSMNFYGDNQTEVILDTGHTEKENLLIIGDSFTHAILKCVASHYNKTFLLDPRYSGISVESLQSYIEDKAISKVLFLNYYSTIGEESFVIPES